jgi:outer membrane murein-binding lipoprotein Lpp
VSLTDEELTAAEAHAFRQDGCPCGVASRVAQLAAEVRSLRTDLSLAKSEAEAAREERNRYAKSTTHEKCWQNGIGLIAKIETLEKERDSLRTQLAEVTAQRDEAQAHRAATNEEIKKLHAVIKSKGFCVEDSVSLHEMRAEVERLTACLEEERTDHEETARLYRSARDRAERLRADRGEGRVVTIDDERLDEMARLLGEWKDAAPSMLNRSPFEWVCEIVRAFGIKVKE